MDGAQADSSHGGKRKEGKRAGLVAPVPLGGRGRKKRKLGNVDMRREGLVCSSIPRPTKEEEVHGKEGHNVMNEKKSFFF